MTRHLRSRLALTRKFASKERTALSLHGPNWGEIAIWLQPRLRLSAGHGQRSGKKAFANCTRKPNNRYNWICNGDAMTKFWTKGGNPVTRHVFPTMLCLLMLAGTSQAQDWARKMFEKTTFDFGTLARGAKAIHTFKLKNIYEETVHITGVRSTCGCTTVEIKHPTVKTFETAEIVADFNTVAFRGTHSSTLTVIIDQPFPAEVQLQVYGNVRTDVVIEPGLVSFGSVAPGDAQQPQTRDSLCRPQRLEDRRRPQRQFEFRSRSQAAATECWAGDL